MKTAPFLRVKSQLQQEAENVLREAGDTQNDPVTEVQKEFLAKSLASRDEAAISGAYYGADDVLDELSAMLAKAKAEKAL